MPLVDFVLFQQCESIIAQLLLRKLVISIDDQDILEVSTQYVCKQLARDTIVIDFP